MNYISVGFQCTVPFVLDKAGIKGPTLPFDWMLAPPKFVHAMLKLLLIDSIDPITLVHEHFFPKTSWARWIGGEEYTKYPEPNCPYDKQYDAIFPHDRPDLVTEEEAIDKYIRRFIRLKDLILNSPADNVFVYISPSSSVRYNGNYFVDGREIIIDQYNDVNDIYDLLSSVNEVPTKFLFIDSFYSDKRYIMNPSIIYRNVLPTNGWKQMIDVCVSEIQL